MGPISFEISLTMLSMQLASPSASPAKPSIAPRGSNNLFLELPPEQVLDVGGKCPPRFLIMSSVLPLRFSISLMAWVLIAGKVISLTQLRPSLTNPSRIPPNMDFCDAAAGPLLGSEVIGIPPGWVGLGTSNDVPEAEPGILAEEPEGADTPVEPDVADGPEYVPVDPGAGVLPAPDVMELVPFFDSDEVGGIVSLLVWDCEEKMLEVPLPGAPCEPGLAWEVDERD